MKFTLHTKDTAPAASQPVLDQVAKAYGFVPNLMATLVESPLAASAYLQLSGLVNAHTVLTPQEQQVAMLVVSAENGCDYCVAAHTMAAGMAKVPEETIGTLRAEQAPADAKTAALARFVKALVVQRGWVSEQEQAAFLAAGFTPRHVLDLVAIVALKTISNYANHLAHTPLDAAFAAHKWTKR